MNFSVGSSGVSDVSLISRYRAGDETACTELLARYANLINCRISGIGITGSDRDDLRQEAYLGLYNAIRTFDLTKSPKFSAYAALCIQNSIRNQFAAARTNKAKLYRQTVSLDDIGENQLSLNGADDPERLYLNKESGLRLKEMTKTLLSGFEREVFFSYLSGCSYSDIAAKLRSSQKSVDNALQRARRKLKAVLNQL